MNCAVHQQTPATAYCRTCGKPMCQACTRNVKGVFFCEDCLAQRVEGIPAAVAGTPTAVVLPGGPNPVVAAILSGLLPFGTGAMYCGEFSRALVQAGVFFGLIAVESTAGDKSNAVAVIFGLGIAFWYFFMIFDSYRVGTAKQTGQPLPDLFGFGEVPAGAPGGSMATAIQPEAASQPRLPIGAFILIGMGVLFMLNGWDLFHFHWMGALWPLMVIGLGIYSFYRRRQRTVCQCARCTAACMMGPAMMVTVGVVGLLAEYTSAGWDKTWPLFLIVLGAIKFIQSSGSTEGHIDNLQPPSVPPPVAPVTMAEGEVHHG